MTSTTSKINSLRLSDFMFDWDCTEWHDGLFMTIVKNVNSHVKLVAGFVGPNECLHVEQLDKQGHLIQSNTFFTMKDTKTFLRSLKLS